MSVKDTWTEIVNLRSKEFVGGDIEHSEHPEGVYRGPIVSLVVEDDKLIVTTEWTAHLSMDSYGLPVGEWRKEEREDATTFTYDLLDDIMSLPQDTGEGRIFFQYPFSRIALFPAGGSKLDPGKVSGL